MLSPRPLITAALTVLLLATGCATTSAPSDPVATSDPAATSDHGEASAACGAPGAISDGIEISGDFGGTVELTSAVPVEAGALERSVLIEGDGETLADGAQVTVSVTIINGASGDVVEAYPDASMVVSQAALTDWAYQGVGCAEVGERSVITVSAEEALGAEYLEGSGFAAGESLVVVFDVLDVLELLEKAEGEAQAAPAGFPEVELAEDGSPSITIPDGLEPPTELGIATLIKGEGVEIAEGDRVFVHYRGIIWRTGEEFDSSWQYGSPVDFVTTEVIGGFSKALVGQTVGSQVIAVVPADSEQGGYGPEALESMGHQPDDVMVFVLDVLGKVSGG